MEPMDMEDDVDGSRSLLGFPGGLQDQSRPYRYLTGCLLLLCAASMAGNVGQIIYFEGRLDSEQPSFNAQTQTQKQVWNQTSKHNSTMLEEQTQLVQRSYDALAKTLAAERDSLQLSNHALTEERDQIQGQFSNLIKERDQIQGQFHTVTKERDQIQGQFNNLIKERDQIQGQFNTLTKERDQIQGQFNTLIKERDQIQGQFNNLTKERDQIQGQFNTFTKERGQIQGQVNTLTKERDQIQGQFNTLTKERDQIQGQLNTLTKERDQIQGQFNTLTKERDQIQGQFNTLIKERDQIQGQFNNLTKERDQIEGHVTTLTKERDQIQGHQTQLQKEVDNLKDKLKSRPCYQGWTKFQDSCYYGSPSGNKKTWDASRQFCTSKDANLVVISSDLEQKFVNNLLPSKTNSWIGFSDTVIEGTWTWLDGTTPIETYWEIGQPNSHGGNQDCAEFVHKSRGQFGEWNDELCSIENPWICEM